ncbi:MAG: preprotein translocase subunit SecG [Pseudomonadales bacterium]|nr:preprotein translocase subunit SecG [Pseudomonadales bacterium]
METIIVVVHVITAIVIVGLVLLQQGKGADAGASFGAGASQTVFGASGSGNFLVRATTIAAVIFFVTSLSLAIFARSNAGVGASTGLPVVDQQLLEETISSQSDIPVLEEEQPASNQSDVPNN